MRIAYSKTYSKNNNVAYIELTVSDTNDKLRNLPRRND